MLAIERDAGLLKLKRRSRRWSAPNRVAKMLMGMVYAAAAVGTLLIAAEAGDTVTLSAGQLASWPS